MYPNKNYYFNQKKCKS